MAIVNVGVVWTDTAVIRLRVENRIGKLPESTNCDTQCIVVMQNTVRLPPGQGLIPGDLVDGISHVVTRQSYAEGRALHGVALDEIRVHRAVDGALAELLQINVQGTVEGLPPFLPAQWSWTVIEPGAVKAWHLHFVQEDLWFVPPTSTLLVGLVDLRRESPSAEQVMRLTLGGGRCHRLLVPRGVAHGVANLATQPQTLLYATTLHFSADPETTDEWRLPWDHFGTEFWRLDRG